LSETADRIGNAFLDGFDTRNKRCAVGAQADEQDSKFSPGGCNLC